MIEIIRSNQLVIQLNSLASVPTPLGRTCINRRSVQTGHSTLSSGNPVWPELTVSMYFWNKLLTYLLTYTGKFQPPGEVPPWEIPSWEIPTPGQP